MKETPGHARLRGWSAPLAAGALLVSLTGCANADGGDATASESTASTPTSTPTSTATSAPTSAAPLTRSAPGATAEELTSRQGELVRRLLELLGDDLANGSSPSPVLTLCDGAGRTVPGTSRTEASACDMLWSTELSTVAKLRVWRDRLHTYGHGFQVFDADQELGSIAVQPLPHGYLLVVAMTRSQADRSGLGRLFDETAADLRMVLA